MARLGDYIEQIRGVSYKPMDLSDFLDENSVPLLRANNIQDGNLNLDDVIYVSKNKVAEKQYLKKGDILICTSSGSKELVGKAAYVKQDMPMVFGAFCKVVRPKTECKKYIGHFFQSPYYRKSISDLSAGANINNIRNEHIEDLEIQLPSLEEQRRIAALLDKVSDLIAKRREQLDKLDLLVKARFVEMFGGDRPTERLECFATLITKGASPRWQGVEYEESGTLFITSENVRPGHVDFEKRKYLNNRINEIQPRSILRRNDILINIVGASIGRAAVFESDELANINQAVALVRIDTKKLNLKFLTTFLNSSRALELYSAMKKGGARDNLSLKNIADLPIPAVPITLQKRFADYLFQTEKSKLTIQQSLDKLEMLKKAMMQKYFG